MLVLKDFPYTKYFPGFPIDYESIFISWRDKYNFIIWSFFWCNIHINNATDSFHLGFSKRDVHFVNQLFNVEGKTKSWDQLERTVHFSSGYK